MPYIDKKGRIYKYGEFFPIEISSWHITRRLRKKFSYHKRVAEENGYLWYEPSLKNFKITILAEKIPDNLDQVDDKS